MAYDFKKEEDVKEYLQNIGTEYRFSCLKERNPEGCHLLGDYLEAVKREFEAAAKIYKNNCEELNYAKSCAKYGNCCYLGRGIEQNFVTAFDFFKKACDLDSPEGCLHAGVMLTVNKDDEELGIPSINKNYVQGLKYLEKACYANNVKACYFASGIYLKGNEEVPKNMSKAAQFSLLACNGRNLYACINLSQMYKRGDGVEQDDKKYQEFRERAKDIRDDMIKKRSIKIGQYT